jgi:hypothetical protein
MWRRIEIDDSATHVDDPWMRAKRGAEYAEGRVITAIPDVRKIGERGKHINGRERCFGMCTEHREGIGKLLLVALR